MVATTAALASAQLAFRALDAPLFVSNNVIADAEAVTLRETDADFTAATEAVAGFLESNLYDGTRATTAKLTTAVTFNVLIDAGSGNQLTADCFIIEGHSWTDGTFGIRVSDTVDGGGLLNGTILTPQAAATATVADRQVVFWSSTFSARYWEISYVSITSGTLTARQVWLGVQRQMRSKTRDPSDPDDDWESTGAESNARSGHSQSTLWSKLRAMDLNFRLISATELAASRAVRDDTDVYIKGFWYCEDPNSDPTGSVAGGLQGRMIYGKGLSGKHSTPSVEGANRNWHIPFKEVGPRLSP